MGTVYGPMLHHTGSVGSGDYPTLRVVRDGRAGLENSLSMYGIGKSGTIYCFNNNISWHAGTGSWNGVTDGNGHFAGIEAESSGNGTDWTAAQVDSYKRLVASILIETGRNTSWMPAHKQWAPTRKPDPAGIDIPGFTKDVEKYRTNPALMSGAEGGDFLMALNDAQQNEILSYVRDIRSWLRGGDPNADNITLLWLFGKDAQVRLGNIENMIKGNNAEGRNNFHWVVEEIVAAVKTIPGADVDEAALAAAISASVKFTPADIAKAVNDEDDLRDRDNNPNTGQNS